MVRATRKHACLLVSMITVSAATTTLALPATASPADPKLAAKLASVLNDSRVQRATSGAVVLDATDGRMLYARNGTRAITPASNTKIITAAAAMHDLGSTFRFHTDVLRRGSVAGGVLHGNLYLKGYGDPTTRQADYRALAQQVRDAGITTVTGALAVDASYFDDQRYNPYWYTGYADDYYAAEISAVTVAPNADYDSGTVWVNYAPGTKGGHAKVSFTPAAAGKYIRLVNQTTTSAKGSRTTFSASRAYGSNTVLVRGKVAAGRRPDRWLITVHQPALYAAAVFRAELSRAKITVRRPTKIKFVPVTKRKLVARDSSMTLAQLLVPFLKLSNNMHAETLTKTMSARAGGPGSWWDGLRHTRAYLKHVGVDQSLLRLVDGSGLTRSNKLTPRELARVLYGAQSETWFPAFSAALPVAGNPTRMVGGTLRYRMSGTRAANNARAKTGSLTGVTALSGYVRGRDGRAYVFSMLSEYGSSSPRPVENELVVALANWRR